MEGIQTYLTVFITLAIIIDPVGNLPFFLTLTGDKPLKEQTYLAGVSTSAAALILILFSLAGEHILSFFRISIPAFQITGGFIFFIYALQMLGLIPSGMKTSMEEEEESIQKENIALVPLATPLLAGPGAITAVLAWRQELHGPWALPFLVMAIGLVCLIVFLVFTFGRYINRVLGVGGIRVITRIMGLLLAVIAVQFMINGILTL